MSVSTTISNVVSAISTRTLCSDVAGAAVPESEAKKFRTIDLDVDIGADAVDYKSVGSTWQHDSDLNNVSQCYCEPGVSVSPRNGDAKAGGFGERNCGRDGVPQEARGAFRQHEQYGSISIPYLRYELTDFKIVSTNQRVQKFAWFTLVALVGLGIWQILHLRAFFKRKYLID